MLENRLLKISSKTRKIDRSNAEGSARTSFPSKTGLTIAESAAFCSFIHSSHKLSHLPVIRYQTIATSSLVQSQSWWCFKFFADPSYWIGWAEIVKTLGQIHSDVELERFENVQMVLRRSAELLAALYLRRTWLCFHGGDVIFSPFAKIFATRPEDRVKNHQCFCCLLCKENISVKSRGLYLLKRHFQKINIYRLINNCALDTTPKKCVDLMDILCMCRSWKLRRINSCNWTFQI